MVLVRFHLGILSYSSLHLKPGDNLALPHLPRQMDIENRSGKDFKPWLNTFNKHKLSSSWSMREKRNLSCCPPPIRLFFTQSPHRFITITFPYTPFPSCRSELPWEVLSWSNLLKESLMSVPNQIATLLDCYVSIQRIQSLLTCQVWVGLAWGGWGMEGIGGSGDWLREELCCGFEGLRF